MLFTPTHKKKCAPRKIISNMKSKTWSVLSAFMIVCGIGANAHLFATPEAAKQYSLVYDKPAPLTIEGWELNSLPLGNGYFGVSFFGGIAEEMWQLSEKSVWMQDPDKTGSGSLGLSSLGEIRVSMDHGANGASNYSRSLNLNRALGTTRYDLNGVSFSRELITSYPDRCFAARLTASVPGKISFRLKADHSYLGATRTGTAEANGAEIVLKGMTLPYKLKYEVHIRIQTKGGKVLARAEGNSGELVVSGADEALVLISLGTNHKLEPKVFTEKNPGKKLEGFEVDQKALRDVLDGAALAGWEKLLSRHQADYCRMFDRAGIDLGGKQALIPTDELLKSKALNTPERRYLEELYFQYGRYLLIASSRVGTLPANLQGTWCMNKTAPWGGNYTVDENINMYYWPSFVTGLEETFAPYHDYFQAASKRSAEVAASWLGKHAPGASVKDVWTIANCDPYKVGEVSEWTSVGVGPYILQNLWTWYEFTDDKAVLEEIWPMLLSSSRFLSAYLKEQPDGKLLCDPSWSPENPERRAEVKEKAQPGYGKNRACLPGTSFDQQMVYENFRMVLEAARILGKQDPILETLRAQISRLDPVQIGDSGQIKEFRQETTYGSIGDPKHRHISHLLGLYPFSLLTEKKEWMDGCRVTLNGRGDGATGWAVAHKISMWARLKDGDRAYVLLNNLLATSTLPNLWDTCPPFQIDGNSGGTAGMAEMLLHSHEGFIDPIPALPKVWSTGSFTGLRTRGAFIVSASWRDSMLVRLKVESMKGNPCKIRLGSGWNVYDQDGVQVKTSKEGNSGVVVFETTKGRSYVLCRGPLVN